MTLFWISPTVLNRMERWWWYKCKQSELIRMFWFRIFLSSSALQRASHAFILFDSESCRSQNQIPFPVHSTSGNKAWVSLLLVLSLLLVFTSNKWKLQFTICALLQHGWRTVKFCNAAVWKYSRLKGKVWRHSRLFLLRTNAMKRPKSTMKLLKTHQWATLLHWVTCSYHHEHTHCSLLRLKPAYTVLLPQIFTRAPNVDPSAAENSPQQMHCFLMFGSYRVLKDGQTHCWFLFFHGICWQQEKYRVTPGLSVNGSHTWDSPESPGMNLQCKHTASIQD